MNVIDQLRRVFEVRNVRALYRKPVDISMLVLLGDSRSYRNIAILQQMGWGRMFAGDPPNPFPHERYGFDNGAFVAFKQRRPFPTEEFTRRLYECLRVPVDPYIAVVPDIVAGGLHSLDFSVNWRLRLAQIHWPWYLAVQDGMTKADVLPVLHMFSGIFLGGSDKFKQTAQYWCNFAHSYQKKFHYGRAGTIRKLQHAYRVGSDSCDSAFPLWTKQRMHTFIRKFQGLTHQSEIF